nr:MAG TPA: hypothetical protein [Bacteriophage sp.]
MQLYFMLERIISRGLYTRDDILQKLDVFYLVGTLTDQEYNTLYNMICPPVQDEVVEEEIEEIDPDMGVEHPEVEIPEMEDEVVGDVLPEEAPVAPEVGQESIIEGE